MSIVNEVVALAQRQADMGYKEQPVGSNKTKYARFFDVEAWQFFNTKKNPCYWCAIFVIWVIYQVLLPILGSGAAIRNWFGMPAPKYNEVRRALIAKLMRRRAIILAGHTHVIDFKRLRSSEGELTQFITSAVWTNEEMAFSKPAATTPKEYGESTGPQLTSERARDDFHTCIGEVKPNLVEYSLTRAAGHATLSVTDASVKATFYPGDSRKPGQVFELVS